MKKINNDDTSELLYEALVRHYHGEMKKAEATLQVYFTNAAGIGEHPQMIEEMAKQVEIMANAEDCIESLKRNFNV